MMIRRCTKNDIDALREISVKTFSETFSDMNPPEIMKAYLNDAFNVEKMKHELENQNSEFYFIYFSGELSGYLKLNDAPAQTDLNDPSSLEIERIYINREFQSKGLGRVLMDFAVKKAIELNKDYVWLGVWEKNEKALSFYRKNGFYRIGDHVFVMGDDRQTDYIMRKDLKE